MSDLNTFTGTIEWVETDVLPAIETNYQRNTSSFAIALITIENDGTVLNEVTPRPIVAEDSSLNDFESQKAFAEMARQVLSETAASGIITVVFAPDEYNDDRVVVSLEHKSGRVTWIATGMHENIKKFERDNSYNWESEFGFSDMLSNRFVN